MVDDKTHIGFVDAHAEGDGGDDDRRLIVGEVALVRQPRRVIQPGVIGQGAPTIGRQLRCQHVNPLARVAIDDARFALVGLQKGQYLGQSVVARFDSQKQIFAVEGGDELIGVAYRQRGLDVAADAVGGRGGNRQADGVGQAAAHPHQLAIVGAEVMAPFRDAMRFVDGQAIDAAFVEHNQRLRPQQGFGAGVDQLDTARFDLPGDLHVAVVGQSAVQVSRGHALLTQLHHLVFHERDERRDDDRQAGEEQRRQLVAQRLAATGGHDGQAVPAGQNVADDVGL